MLRRKAILAAGLAAGALSALWAYARWLADQLPNARLQVVPRARHMVVEERAEQANQAILAFLAVASP